MGGWGALILPVWKLNWSYFDTTDRQTIQIDLPHQPNSYRITSRGTPCLRCGQGVQGSTAAFARSVGYSSWMSRRVWSYTRHVWNDGGSDDRQRRCPFPSEGQDGHGIRACCRTSTAGRLEGFSMNLRDGRSVKTEESCVDTIQRQQRCAFWAAVASEPSKGYVQTTAVFELRTCVSATMDGGMSLSTSKVCATCISISRCLVPTFSLHSYSSMSACSWVLPYTTHARSAFG